ncbi:unnamed protein product [Plutella xylostella]|uniref:(diamondback moth) hypothetical protein n=1 Tax=Plutella xylostella TaxID=51655 RepID=A0A8S4DZP0_PLUXY|nr:unnamed protein product [Plutella xylostella]
MHCLLKVNLYLLKMKVFLVLALFCASSLAATVDLESNIESVEGRVQNIFIELSAAGAENAEDEKLIKALNAQPGARNFIEDLILDALENARDVIINGNAVLPPLDPLTIDQLGPYRYSTTGARVSAEAKNLRLEGLRWFLVDRLVVNPLRLTFGLHITVPRLEFNSRYEVRARVALLLTHRSAGNIRVFLNRMEFGVDARLGTNIFGGGHLVLRSLNIKIDVHDTQISITGMTGSSLINAVISNTIQNISQSVIQDNLEKISRILSEELFVIINEILKDYKLADLGW